MSCRPRLLAIFVVLLGAGVAGATPNPSVEPTVDSTTATNATPTTAGIEDLLAEIDDSDGDGVPDEHDLAPYHPGIQDRNDLDPRGGDAPGIAAALVALLGAGALALRRSPPPQL